tara:strand:- start:7315 stop:7992 length:678 start_codon:yes stop_codon:yes gene_type:complete
MTVRWTKKEKDYMMNLALEEGMDVHEVVKLLNEKFDNKRTASAVHGQKHLILKEYGLTRKNRTTGIPVGIKFNPLDGEGIINFDELEEETEVDGTIVEGHEAASFSLKSNMPRPRNSGKSWTTADEQYLVAQWTADEEVQTKVANHLGRSVKGCHTRLARLRKYNPDLHTALINNSIVKIIPGETKLTWLDKLYIFLKNRKERKQAKRNAKIRAKINKLKGELYE